MTYTLIAQLGVGQICIKRHHIKSHFIKDHVKSVLRISSAHNKGGPTDTNIAQILHLQTFLN